jgi:hypothetical protein
MKKIIALSGLILLFFPNLALAETFTSENYAIAIEQNCAEGEVTCDNVSYQGVAKKTGNRIELKGSTWHSMCPDGVTPCQFLGYWFENGNTSYSVSVFGLLQIRRGDEIIVQEQGVWSYVH